MVESCQIRFVYADDIIEESDLPVEVGDSFNLRNYRLAVFLLRFFGVYDLYTDRPMLEPAKAFFLLQKVQKILIPISCRFLVCLHCFFLFIFHLFTSYHISNSISAIKNPIISFIVIVFRLWRGLPIRPPYNSVLKLLVSIEVPLVLISVKCQFVIHSV